MKLIKNFTTVVVFFISLRAFSAVFPVDAINQWPNGIVYYEDMSDVSAFKQEQIRQAMSLWSSTTPISFKKAILSDAPRYIKFIENGTGCGTGVDGAINGRINVWVPCGVGGIAHELGHIIGFGHEQNRTDRDFYIDMDLNTWTSQVQIGRRYIDYGPMDYDSIMMYGMYDKNGNIVGASPTVPSAGDIAAVYAMYSDAFNVRLNGKWFAGKINQQVASEPMTVNVNGGQVTYSALTGISISDAGLPVGASVRYQAYTASGWSAPVGNGSQLTFSEMQDFTAWLVNAPGYSLQYSIRVGGVWYPWQADGTYAADKKTRGTITGFKLRIKGSQKLRTSGGYCLDIFQNYTAVAGTNVSVWSCTGRGEQEFIFARHPSVSLLNPLGQPPSVWETGMQIKTINDLCLVPKNNILSAGTNIELGQCCLDGSASCSVNTAHFWFIDKDNQIKNYANPSYCLRVTAIQSGANLELASCSSGAQDRKFYID